MKEIKTIVTYINDSKEFDKIVNKALKNGWILTDTQVVRADGNGFHRLVAFLEREIEEN